MRSKEKLKKIIKTFAKINFVLVLILSFGFLINYFAITSSTNLNNSKLTLAASTNTMQIYDSNGNEFESTKKENHFVTIDNIPKHTINAFLTSEDRSFYSHRGIDYKRICGALVQNIKTRKFKQGGSTISQQLIKNTHLSNEKTLNRKLKEFKLTKQLERNYTKDQILELYLNTIYFGNGCYGIQEASNFYFGKSTNNLSIAESAILAGIISSPSNNEPVSNFERSTRKKNIILSNMHKLGHISDNEYMESKSENIILTKTRDKSETSQFMKSTLLEATKILNLSENQIKNQNISIYTALDCDLDTFVKDIVSNQSFSPANDKGEIPIVQSLVINNASRQVISYATNQKWNIETLRRQPGSAIKPVLVYAPAFEYKNITPSSTILDEKTTFGDYTPKNSGDKYQGWTTIRSSISKSLNVPAVKTLSYVGINKAINFAENLGLNFNTKDKHLAIALGGMTDGVTLKQLAESYSSFACSGKYSKSKFITKIVDSNGRVLYEHKIKEKQVMSEETAYMITSSLLSAVKQGTAKKLYMDGIEIASKTGTTNNSKEAWNICYTTDYTIATFIGNKDHSQLHDSINGATYPTLINREIMKKIIEKKGPKNFNIPDGIINANIEIDSENSSEPKLSQNQSRTSENNEIFTKTTLPELNINSSPQIKLHIINEQNKDPIIKIYSQNAESITIFKEFNNKTAVFKKLINPDKNIKLKDNETKRGEIISYYATAKNENNTTTTEKIKVKVF